MRRVTGWLVLALLCPGIVNAYPTDVAVNSKGLDVEAIATQLDEATVVRVVNNESFPVRCDVHFANGPEITRIRKLTVAPDSDHLTRFNPTRVVIRLRVTVDCWRDDEDKESN
jgi:hypothetical protein